jgi:hypothetical protein
MTTKKTSYVRAPVGIGGAGRGFCIKLRKLSPVNFRKILAVMILRAMIRSTHEIVRSLTNLLFSINIVDGTTPAITLTQKSQVRTK